MIAIIRPHRADKIIPSLLSARLLLLGFTHSRPAIPSRIVPFGRQQEPAPLAQEWS